MTEDFEPILIRELGLAEIEPGGPVHDAFIMLHREWVARGVSRWLGLLRRDGPHPTIIYGAFARGRLVGAVVGVWAPYPIDRFDDLFATSFGATSSRPMNGAWHLIAVTTDGSQDVRGLGLGRALLGRILAWAGGHGHSVVRTLSPAVGFPDLLAQWPGDALDAVRTACRADGKPALQVMRLHNGGGAVLERVLSESRSDDVASGRVTLRFLYATDAIARGRQRDAWQAWCERRAALIADGHGTRIPGSTLYRVTTERDASVVLG